MTVERLVLGCAPLGNLYTPIDDDDATATIDTAWEAGIRTFDTAPLYGHGLSERRLGRALAPRPRSEFTVCTKVGRVLTPGTDTTTIFADVPPLRPTFDFSRDGIRRSVEDSLHRLGLDFIDVVHVHDPDDHLDAAIEHAFPTLAALVDEGVIGAIGLGTNTPEVADRVLAEVEIDRLLLAGRVTLLDRSGLDTVVPTAAALGVQVFAAGVFNSGVLADPVPGAHFDYEPAPEAVVERARRIHEVASEHGASAIAAAVQFPFRFAGITSVVLGARSPDEVADDVAAATSPLPEALWGALEATSQR